MNEEPEEDLSIRNSSGINSIAKRREFKNRVSSFFVLISNDIEIYGNNILCDILCNCVIYYIQLYNIMYYIYVLYIV